MYRAVKVMVAVCGAALAAGCGDSSRISSELQNDLALASAGGDLELASRPADELRVMGAAERTTPPSRAIANSARAPRPRRSPTPRITADVQEETELVEEPEVAEQEEPMPAPAPIEEAPVEIAATARPRAIEPVSSGGSGNGSRGTDWGTIIGIAGTVVLRGGEVGEDRCIPPSSRGRTISINDRFPIPRGRGTGRVAMGGGRTGGRVMGGGRMGGGGTIRTAPARPRDISTRPMASPPSSIRPMPSGGTGGITSPIAQDSRGTTSAEVQ